ncbi:hypothetical protein MLD38_008571 [Melastoma candidum]|uniref:Uncharacterized protein n=1 Tax=Melastoma candidum TaxID=119954 RepID=A0ACB9RUG0_9MYRT|nr:hypothetical protein MLD38_008571 [Melastoma candidum]
MTAIFPPLTSGAISETIHDADVTNAFWPRENDRVFVMPLTYMSLLPGLCIFSYKLPVRSSVSFLFFTDEIMP